MGNHPLTEDLPLFSVVPPERAEVFVEAAEHLAHLAPTEDDLDGSAGSPTLPQRPPSFPTSQLQDRLRIAGPGGVRLGPYRVTRYLDGGGTGDVYEAFVGSPGTRVAMKVLREITPYNLSRFKREFRNAQEVCHPSLIAVHELCVEDGEWFFTMDLVDGTDFIRHVRGGSARGAGRGSADGGPTRPIEGASDRLEGSADSDEPTSPPTPPASPLDELVAPPSIRLAPRFDEARLRRALVELCRGVLALHEAGKLHLDLNPNNVKVTATGRVTILDFGLLRDDRPEREPDRQRRPCGTPPYMAPEQCDDCPSTASDWYAFGVILFEALTGRLPFHEGGTQGILAAKQRQEAPPPESFVDGLPDDLAALCRALLRRDPAARPTGAEVLAALVEREARPRPRRAPRALLDDRARFFVGRAGELCGLEEAFAAASRGRVVTVVLRGPAGRGKSALGDHFVQGLALEGRARVLSGRCRKQERLPYHGLDALVDALAEHLRALSPTERASLLPAGLCELVRLFPMLDGGDIPSAPAGSGPAEGSQHAAAREALLELLHRLGERKPLVLWLDDMQNTDRESLRWLHALVEPSGRRPSLLVILSVRTDHTGFPEDARLPYLLPGKTWRVDVPPLDRSESIALALSRLPRDELAQARAVAIADEAGGEPRAIDDLVRWAEAHRDDEGTSPPISLDAVYAARIRQLSRDAAALLEVVCMTDPSIAEPIAFGAVGFGGLTAARVMHELRHAGLVHRTVGQGSSALAARHPRVRDLVRSALDARRRLEIHRALAAAIAAAPPIDPALLAEHLAGAGDRTGARQKLILAGEAARSAGDLHRAAKLYDQAIALEVPGEAQDGDLLCRRAEVAAAEGRFREAVALYLDGIERAPREAGAARRLRAAELLFALGDPTQALAQLVPALAAHDLHVPADSGAARDALRAGWRRLRLRGTSTRPAPSSRSRPRGGRRSTRPSPRGGPSRRSICSAAPRSCSTRSRSPSTRATRGWPPRAWRTRPPTSRAPGAPPRARRSRRCSRGQRRSSRSARPRSRPRCC
ncbi:MAG: protein kinase [Byssovorax sp.]